jgi:hypothetical protein
VEADGSYRCIARGDLMKKEECCECGEYTGRAGIGEDSLYTDDCIGPYCEDCWQGVEDSLKVDD